LPQPEIAVAIVRYRFPLDVGFRANGSSDSCATIPYRRSADRAGKIEYEHHFRHNILLSGRAQNSVQFVTRGWMHSFAIWCVNVLDSKPAAGFRENRVAVGGCLIQEKNFVPEQKICENCVAGQKPGTIFFKRSATLLKMQSCKTANLPRAGISATLGDPQAAT
jgi:hypothetical protein